MEARTLRGIEMTLQINGPAFFTTYMALRALKQIEKCNEAHVHFIRRCGKSLVTISALLRRVEHTWRHEHRQIETTLQINGPAVFHHLHGLVRVQRDWKVQ